MNYINGFRVKVTQFKKWRNFSIRQFWSRIENDWCRESLGLGCERVVSVYIGVSLEQSYQIMSVIPSNMLQAWAGSSNLWKQLWFAMLGCSIRKHSLFMDWQFLLNQKCFWYRWRFRDQSAFVASVIEQQRNSRPLLFVANVFNIFILLKIPDIAYLNPTTRT